MCTSSITYVRHLSNICFFSDIPVNICLHAKTCVNIMYYMRLHNVYICITSTNLTYIYILQTYVGHDRRNKKHMSFTDRKRHVKSCNLSRRRCLIPAFLSRRRCLIPAFLSRRRCLIPAYLSCFMTEVADYYYLPWAFIIQNKASEVSNKLVEFTSMLCDHEQSWPSITLILKLAVHCAMWPAVLL